MTVKLYSFDVFDTLITRKTATCNGIFMIMQDVLIRDAAYRDIPTHLKENFQILRKQCERVARYTYVNAGWQDVTISQIYHCMRTTLGLSEEQEKQLKQLEISTEYENSIAIHENIHRVARLVEDEKKVVLISNMYLSEKALRNMLLKHSSMFKNITLYVSCEFGKTKGTGELYRYVREQEGVSFKEWKHVGDNTTLDIEVPGSLGMQTEKYSIPGGMAWERYFLKEKEDNLAIQLAIAPSLLLQRQSSRSYPYLVGCSYSAPILYPYIKWVLEQSRKKGIRTLFFIARDGYILKKMSDCVIQSKGLEIQTEYLYGSRKAWRLPAVCPNTFDMRDFLKWDYSRHFYSYKEIAELFEFDLDELRQFLPFVVDDEVELTPRFLLKVYDFMIRRQKEIAEYISEKQRENRCHATAYLSQEIGKAKGRYAFVDLIGSGYTQKCLADLIEAEEPLLTFYYRLDSCKEYLKNINYAFYPNRQELGNVIEVLCGAEHGQTIGYQEKNGTWIPVMCRDEGQALGAYGYKDYLQGIMDYTEVCVKDNLYGYSSGSLDVPRYYFQFLEEAADRRLYDFVMDMPYGVSGRENEVQSFAPQISNSALRKIYLTHVGENTRKYYNGYHLESALLRMSVRQKKRMELYKKISGKPVGRWIRSMVTRYSRTKRLDNEYYMFAKRVVIYGAGKRGQSLYRLLTGKDGLHTEVVLWVDRNCAKYQKEGLDVSAVEELDDAEYDQILVAVKEEKVACEIRRELVAREIQDWKILWVQSKI